MQKEEEKNRNKRKRKNCEEEINKLIQVCVCLYDSLKMNNDHHFPKFV